MKFKNEISLAEVNAFNKNTLMDTLGMECVEIGDVYLKIKMPVNSKVHQPMGTLHGGASVALIESIGSMGSALLIDITKFTPVGLEVNANHIGFIEKGNVIATGTIIHSGRRTHVWSVEIHDEESNKLICTGRLTVMIIPRIK